VLGVDLLVVAELAVVERRVVLVSAISTFWQYDENGWA
jgi:hypothetical protein